MDPESNGSEDGMVENYQSPENLKILQLIKSAGSLREFWNKKSFEFSGTLKETVPITADALGKKLTPPPDLNFDFMNVNAREKEQVAHYIFPMLIFMFKYLPNVRTSMDVNDSMSRQRLMIQTLTFQWMMFSAMVKSLNTIEEIKDEDNKRVPILDPMEYLGMKDKKLKVEFLNKYAYLLFQLKSKKSDLLILKDLVKFARQYIFANKQRIPNIRGEKKTSRPVEDIVSEIKFDSFMELYDYLEELEKGKDISENYKENIMNLFVQIVSQFDRFKKHIPDIRNMVKLLEGDLSKLEYFIDKLFLKAETANYTKSNMHSYMSQLQRSQDSNCFHESFASILEQPKGHPFIGKNPKGVQNEADNEDNLGRLISIEDRVLLLKRASSGFASPSDIFTILRGRHLTNSIIKFAEIDLVFKRLGIDLTIHRFCEFLSATKLIKSKKTLGYTRLNFSYIEGYEFESTYEYLEELVMALTKESMAISPRRLLNLSLASLLVFFIMMIVVSNLIKYFFEGELFGSLFIALIPVSVSLYITKISVKKDNPKAIIKDHIEKIFEVITTSKSELVL